MIRFYSTSNSRLNASLDEAVFQGLAPDGGLFMPRQILPMDSSFFSKLPALTFQEIAFEAADHFLQKSIPAAELKRIVDQAITFDAPLVRLSEDLHALELFHGPTLSFKDFGARFMARLMAYLRRDRQKELLILAATSGDTGSAVAHGFFGVPGIKVCILYPKGQVSHVQEQQLTTIGHNVIALEIEGTFDDCQRLVKQAFNEPEITASINLTSANSINVARLIPQSFYYFYAYAQLKQKNRPVVFSVPSGNFGNLTAGLFAKKMGLPVERFIAATNANDAVPNYLQTGQFTPHSSKKTLSNAMDVGNPSNFARMMNLYGSKLMDARREIHGVSFSDSETEKALTHIYQNYQYVADPHGAIAFAGFEDYARNDKKCVGIFLETAHPAKFLEVVEPLIGKKVDLPESLRKALSKKKQSIPLSKHFEDFKEFLFIL